MTGKTVRKLARQIIRVITSRARNKYEMNKKRAASVLDQMDACAIQSLSLKCTFPEMHDSDNSIR